MSMQQILVSILVALIDTTENEEQSFVHFWSRRGLAGAQQNTTTIPRPRSPGPLESIWLSHVRMAHGHACCFVGYNSKWSQMAYEIPHL